MTSFRLLGAFCPTLTGAFCPILSNLVCALLKKSAPTFAATFYVDDSGLRRAATVLRGAPKQNRGARSTRGKPHQQQNRLFIKNGTYNEGFTITGPSGTAAAHTVISAYPGRTPVLKGSGFRTIEWGTRNYSYIDFIGFEITNYNKGCI